MFGWPRLAVLSIGGPRLAAPRGAQPTVRELSRPSGLLSNPCHRRSKWVTSLGPHGDEYVIVVVIVVFEGQV